MEQFLKLEQKLEHLALLLNGIPQRQFKTLLNFQEAANYLSISKSTLYKHTSAGKIAYYKPNGKLILFNKVDLDNWIEAHRIPSNEELVNETQFANKSKRNF